MWQAEQRDPSIIVEMYAARAVGSPPRTTSASCIATSSPTTAHRRRWPRGASSISGRAHGHVVSARMRSSAARRVYHTRARVALGCGARRVALDSPLTMDARSSARRGSWRPSARGRRRRCAQRNQFSFCVALFQALYRQDPFFGADARATRAREARGQIRRPPEDAHVPPHVEHAILRGLATTTQRSLAGHAALVRANHVRCPRRRAVARYGGARRRSSSHPRPRVGSGSLGGAQTTIAVLERRAPRRRGGTRIVAQRYRCVFGCRRRAVCGAGRDQATASLERVRDAVVRNVRRLMHDARSRRAVDRAVRSKHAVSSRSDARARGSGSTCSRGRCRRRPACRAAASGVGTHRAVRRCPVPLEAVRAAATRRSRSRSRPRASCSRRRSAPPPRPHEAGARARSRGRAHRGAARHGPPLAEASRAMARCSRCSRVRERRGPASSRAAARDGASPRRGRVHGVARLASIVGDRLSRHAEGCVGSASPVGCSNALAEGLRSRAPRQPSKAIFAIAWVISRRPSSHTSARSRRPSFSRGPDESARRDVARQPRQRLLPAASTRAHAPPSSARHGSRRRRMGRRIRRPSSSTSGSANALTALERWDEAEQRILAARKVYGETYGEAHPSWSRASAPSVSSRKGASGSVVPRALRGVLTPAGGCRRSAATGLLADRYKTSDALPHRETAISSAPAEARRRSRSAIACSGRSIRRRSSSRRAGSLSRAQGESRRGRARRSRDHRNTMAKVGADPLAIRRRPLRVRPHRGSYRARGAQHTRPHASPSDIPRRRRTPRQRRSADVDVAARPPGAVRGIGPLPLKAQNLPRRTTR